MQTITMTPPQRTLIGNIIADFDLLSDAAFLDDKQLGMLLGRRVSTIKKWRQLGRGPKFTVINGRPRASVGAIRRWVMNLPS